MGMFAYNDNDDIEWFWGRGYASNDQFEVLRATGNLGADDATADAADANTTQLLSLSNVGDLLTAGNILANKNAASLTEPLVGQNTTAGVAAAAQMTIKADAGEINLRHNSSTYTTSGAYRQDGGLIMSGSTSSGGLTLASAHSTAHMEFFVGGVAAADMAMYIGDFHEILMHGGNLTVGDGSGIGQLTIQSSTTGSPKIQFLQNGDTKAGITYADTNDIFQISADGEIRLATVNAKGLYLTSSGIDFVGGLLMTERASRAYTPAATKGEVWVQSATPNELKFTDDAGTKHALHAIHGTEQATTSGTTKDFTGLPEGTKKIIIQLEGVSWSGTNPFLLVQIGDSGGIETSGYISEGIYVNTSGGSGGQSSTAGFVAGTHTTNTANWTGEITLSLKDPANHTWVCSGVYGSTVTSYMTITTGAKSLSARLDRVRLTSVSANTFDAGSVNIIYE
jgi:hypothetical protein